MKGVDQMPSRDDQFNQIQTVEELRQFVNYDEFRGRLIFVLKIFYILQFAKKHPEKMEEIGASWCKDGFHFVSNSKILAKFLNLKSNSINTNFRDHGFKIIPYQASKLKEEFPKLQDTRHWKVRFSNCTLFNGNSTGKDVETVKSIYQNISSIIPDAQDQGQQQPNSTISDNPNFRFLPPETINLLQKDQSQLFGLVQLFFSVPENEVFFYNFLKFVTDIWIHKISPTEEQFALSTVISIILDVNFDDEDSNIDSKQWLYYNNLKFLLVQNFEDSQISDFISFLTFAKFCLRFADKYDLSSTLKEVSNVFVDLSSSSSTSFYNWFYPTNDKVQAANLLMKQPNESWIVIPSKSPNSFTLLLCNGQKPFTVLALHINHNPMPDAPKQRYSVSFNDGEKYGETLNDVFTNILKLNDCNIVVDQPCQPHGTNYVSGDDIVNRNNKVIDGIVAGALVNAASDNDNDVAVDFGDSQNESQGFSNTFRMDSQIEGNNCFTDFWRFSQSSQISFSQLDLPSQLNSINNNVDDDDDCGINRDDDDDSDNDKLKNMNKQ